MKFLVLLLMTLLVSLGTALFIDQLFRQPIKKILTRLVTGDLSSAWQRYLRFAIYIVGISGGVPVYKLEQYITGRGNNNTPLTLTSTRIALEIYRTMIQTAQSVAWMLLVFFVTALIAYVILRGFELRRQPPVHEPLDHGEKPSH
ncbi:MAG: hypothetical protein HC812_01050 [Leptolyngbya sp. RL_3_1]|nr:hypothetical protein [Leptolyngbya sp. RL_3_1]